MLRRGVSGESAGGPQSHRGPARDAPCRPALLLDGATSSLENKPCEIAFRIVAIGRNRTGIRVALVSAVSHLCDTFFHGRPFDLVCDARLAGGFGRCCLQWMLRKCVGSAVAVVAGAFDTLGAHSTAANYSTRGSFSGKHSPFCTRRSRTHCAYCDLRHGCLPPCASYTAGIH
ncbi:hypothetical protein SFRURICE_018447, partial [Spodoptera frugiperda]